jgi:hypothetical protein
VIGIEMNAAAVSDAHKNAENNGIKNCRFICSKVRSAVLIFQILVESVLYLASHIHYGFFRPWEKFQFALFFFPCIKIAENIYINFNPTYFGRETLFFNHYSFLFF